MDYYRTLGIGKTSTQDDIKRAYKKLAMQHHPDRPDGNAEEFKRVTEAYETLKDPVKRKQYDQPQETNNFGFRSHNFSQGQNPFAGSPFEDLFRGRHPHANVRGEDITVRVIVDLKDIVNGKIETVQYRLKNGKIETVRAEIPTGARQGDTIRYTGLGDISDPRIPRGDLYIRVHIREPRDWARDGNNLVTKRKIDVFDILQGCAIIIETIDDKRVSLNIPKGTKHGTILSIPGYGVPDLKTKKQGNLYVQIEIELPKIHDQEILTKIKELQEIIKEKT